MPPLLHNGHKKILIRTVDTDVVVLAVALARTLKEETVVTPSAQGKAFHFLAANGIARALGPEKAQALPMFHALLATGMSFPVRPLKLLCQIQ